MQAGQRVHNDPGLFISGSRLHCDHPRARFLWEAAWLVGVPVGCRVNLDHSPVSDNVMVVSLLHPAEESLFLVYCKIMTRGWGLVSSRFSPLPRWWVDLGFIRLVFSWSQA